MFLERTISQLDIGRVSQDKAHELGHLGFMQWLGGLSAQESYIEAAQLALNTSRIFAGRSPAIAVYCDLLTASMRMPPQPLTLTLSPRGRRGGARARRVRF